MAQLQRYQSDQLYTLRGALQIAQQALMTAEAELSQRQAAINAFRMHCRLKLDQLVDLYQELGAQKQSVWTQLQLRQQAEEMGIPFDENDPFWQGQSTEPPPPETYEEPLLPTATARDKTAEKRLYRELARKFHPDLAETAVEKAYRTSMMAAINNAYAGDNIEALYDLAGELDPDEMAELAQIEHLEIRKLRRQILQIQQRQRRAQRRLDSLMQENTARLWQKAQELDNGSEDWWHLVRREIEQAIEQRQEEIASLHSQLQNLHPDPASSHTVGTYQKGNFGG
ncbi:MAG: hypothetical protein H6658_07860 [Ardenticatenaceae bacterium]|nr:hypothetical protein [Ardenticatenaceae bacterium]